MGNFIKLSPADVKLALYKSRRHTEDQRFGMHKDIAGAARFLLDSCGVDGPMVDPFAMAEAWGLSVVDGPESSLAHGTLTVRGGIDTGRRFDVAHELGHVVAQHTGLDHRCERTASAIAASTLLPEVAFKRDLGAYVWDLELLTELYGVSYQVAVRRVTELRGSVVSVWERGRVIERWRSSWLHGRGFSRRRLPSWERGLASECELHQCSLVKSDGHVRAFWSAGRVWVLSEIEAWEAYSRYSQAPHT